MTWGASLMRLPDGMTMSEIAKKYGDDYTLPLLGTVTEIGNVLKSLFPDSEHLGDESTIETEYTYVRFNYRDRTGDGTVESIGVISNGDEDGIAVIKTVCERLDLRMVDHQSGEIADFETEPRRSMEEYRAFCERTREQKQRDD
jgi:hypothetical protein